MKNYIPLRWLREKATTARLSLRPFAPNDYRMRPDHKNPRLEEWTNNTSAPSSKQHAETKQQAAWRESVTLTKPAYAVGRVIDGPDPRHPFYFYFFMLRDYFGVAGSIPYGDPGDYAPVWSGRAEAKEQVGKKKFVPVCNIHYPQRYHQKNLGWRRTDRPLIAFSPCARIAFPPPADRNVNMMPFFHGDKDSLPEFLQPYHDALIAKCPVQDDEAGSIMYLTVQEGFVHAKSTQRRHGLHVEAPGGMKSVAAGGTFGAAMEHPWGGGGAQSEDELHGGLYIASSVNRTTAVWNALIDTKLGEVDPLGGMEHLRPYVGHGQIIPANILVWMTDRTPHEGIPQEEDGYRQFFRLVTSDISLWFAKHSTPNPKVPVPQHVEIINESKFG